MHVKSILFFGLLCCAIIEPAAAKGGSPTVKTSSLMSKYLALAERMKDLERSQKEKDLKWCQRVSGLEKSLERLELENEQLCKRVMEHDDMIQEIGDTSARTIAMHASIREDVARLDRAVQNLPPELDAQTKKIWIYVQNFEFKMSQKIASIESRVRALDDAASLRSDMQLLEERLNERMAMLALAQMIAKQANCMHGSDDSDCSAPSSRASTASCGSARPFGGGMKRCPTASCFSSDDDEHVVFSPPAAATSAHLAVPSLLLKGIKPGCPGPF